MATSIWLHRRENYSKTKIVFNENYFVLAFPSHKTCKYIAFYKDQRKMKYLLGKGEIDVGEFVINNIYVYTIKQLSFDASTMHPRCKSFLIKNT